MLVGAAGIDVVISGGSEQAFASTDSGVVLSGRQSIDIDYPESGTSGLSFFWECEELYPTAGGSCNRDDLRAVHFEGIYYNRQ